MTLRIRLFALVLVALIPALLVIADTAVDHYRHIHDSLRREVLAVGRHTVNLHASRVFETQQLLGLLLAIPQVRGLQPETCSALLQDVLAGNPGFVNFGVIRTDGTVACSAVAIPPDVNLADRGYFQEALRTRRLSVGDYQVGRLAFHPVQVIAQPLLDSDTQVQAVVFAALNLDRLIRSVTLDELPQDAVLYALDRRAVVLARSPDTQVAWRGQNLADSTSFGEALLDGTSAESIAEGTDPDGIHRMYAVMRLGTDAAGEGFILVGIPTREIQAALRADLLPRLGLVALAFTAILILAWYVGEMLVIRRTRLVADATRRLSEGDFSARALVGGQDEMAYVAHELNRLGVKLQDDKHQIDRLNRIHRVLSGINGAILRIRDQGELLRTACRIAVEQGGLSFAWVGLLDQPSRHLVPLATFGAGNVYLQSACLSTPDLDAAGSSPCIIAVREGRMVICNDIRDASQEKSWVAPALGFGFHSIGAFPLHREGRTTGVIGLHASEPHFFDEVTTGLFLELAADISLGLEYIDKDQLIAHMTDHDVLTGLPNRKLALDRLQQAIVWAKRKQRYVTVVVLNVTGFHRLVGTHGHHVADEVLRELARHLQAHVRSADTVARLEGDEFAILFPEVNSEEDAVTIAADLFHGLPRSLHGSGLDIHPVIRGGVSLYPVDAVDAAALLVNATLACNSGPIASSSSVRFFSSDIQRAANERDEIERALRLALMRGNELQVHYQPVVDISTFQVVGVEALTRWHSAQLGDVPPDRFIPVAEESDLIAPLGDWVLRSTCRQVEAWRLQGLKDIRVAVNISFHQMRDPGFVDELYQTVIDITPRGWRQLAVELTESELMDNVEQTIAQLSRLKTHGFTIYIDDFGTGYSSLSHLQRLPVDVLKIDKSFVDHLSGSQSDQAIVRTIVALARSLGLKTIAEGVETMEQLAILQGLGCDCAQGYLFGRALPEKEITQLLHNGRLPPLQVETGAR